MNRFGRRRRRVSEPHREVADQPSRQLCWVLRRASDQPIAAAQVAVVADMLELSSDAPPELVAPRQRLDRLAQVDV